MTEKSSACVLDFQQEKTMHKHDDVKKSALDYHRYPTPGKIEIAATKPLATQRDLALAYTPGVAAVCDDLVRLFPWHGDYRVSVKQRGGGDLYANCDGVGHVTWP